MADRKPMTVLIAVDASQEAEKAFNWYLENQHKEADTIVCFYTVETADIYPNDYMEIPAVSVVSENWTKCMDQTDALTTEYEKKLKQNNVSGNVKYAHGAPGPSIVSAAEQEQANLIVMGTRGMGTIRRTILGSVSDYVIHHAKCPVMVYRDQ